MDISYHYPPELLNLLVDTVPLLCRSKNDVLLFLRGAGTPHPHLTDLEERVRVDRRSITKYEIVRTVLVRLNEAGEGSLRERREVLKRVVEFEDFTRCWPDDQLKAKGLVAEISRVVNVKDSFTRMRQEREVERSRNREAYQRQVQEKQQLRLRRDEVKQELFGLFTETDPSKRGLKLEKCLNDLFAVYEISVRESFRRVEDKSVGALEQIDGVIALEGEVYLVEVKWLAKSVGVDDVSRHLVRVYGRGAARGLFVSATEFTDPAIKECKTALSQKVVTLCLLQEIIEVIGAQADLAGVLRKKVKAAVIDKEPFVRWNQL